MDGLDEACEVIARNRDVADAMARLAPDVLEAGAKAGLWLLAAPREVGGHNYPYTSCWLSLSGWARPTPRWRGTR